jgi:hypothetical protein
MSSNVPPPQKTEAITVGHKLITDLLALLSRLRCVQFQVYDPKDPLREREDVSKECNWQLVGLISRLVEVLLAAVKLSQNSESAALPSGSIAAVASQLHRMWEIVIAEYLYISDLHELQKVLLTAKNVRSDKKRQMERNLQNLKQNKANWNKGCSTGLNKTCDIFYYLMEADINHDKRAKCKMYLEKVKLTLSTHHDYASAEVVNRTQQVYVDRSLEFLKEHIEGSLNAWGWLGFINTTSGFQVDRKRVLLPKFDLSQTFTTGIVTHQDLIDLKAALQLQTADAIDQFSRKRIKYTLDCIQTRYDAVIDQMDASKKNAVGVWQDQKTKHYISPRSVDANTSFNTCSFLQTYMTPEDSKLENSLALLPDTNAGTFVFSICII